MTFDTATDFGAQYGSPSFPESSNFPGAYEPAQEDYVGRFNRLVRQWRIETLVCSRVEEKIQHHAFQEIVAIGEPVVPLIVGEIKRLPDFLFIALHQITKEDPLGPSDIGHPDRMIDAWLRWAERNKIDAD